MKASSIFLIPAAVCLVSMLTAQTSEDSLIEPVGSPAAGIEAGTTTAVTTPPPPSVPDIEATRPVELPLTTPDAAPPTVGESFAPLEQQKEASPEGFIIKDANLNDIFQYLAKAAGRQYFHNSKIAGPEFLVTGHLNEGNPLQQMEELAFMYGLSMHVKGNTIYALTQAQLAQLPSAEFQYQLRYLRPTDITQIKELIKPMLSPGTGIVNFEPKTNTIIIIDTAHRIEQARELLHNIDQAKGQIIIETKILRVNSSAAERVGVNWSASLGEDGTSLRISRDLSSMLGIDQTTTSNNRIRSSGSGSLAENATGILETVENSSLYAPGLILSPLELNGVLRALAEGGIARQLSNPTLITEDNEQATISIIDRVPIITSTTTPGAAGSEPIITEEVRYKIDTADKTIDTDPEKHREIGISLVVTPTLLPDGTVRMKMRPRSAQITGEVVGTTGNVYPRVTESMVETLARVPDGHSLVVGGFYGQRDEKDDTKIPLLGDIPVLNFFFKSKETVKEQASLVFVVTPKSYNPANIGANGAAYSRVNNASALTPGHDWVDPHNAGPAHHPNMARSVRGVIPQQAPLFPDSPDAFVPATSAPSSIKNRFSKASRR